MNGVHAGDPPVPMARPHASSNRLRVGGGRPLGCGERWSSLSAIGLMTPGSTHVEQEEPSHGV
jgi:hypothetical protein